VEKIKSMLAKSSLPFEELLSRDLLNEAVDRFMAGCRNTVFNGKVTLLAFLGQVFTRDSSCSDAVIRIVNWYSQQGKTRCSPSTGAYCDARKRLSVEMLEFLVKETSKRALAKGGEMFRWLGHDAYVVDGTTYSLPDTPENREAFPPNDEKVKGVRFPIIRAVAVFSLFLGTTVAHALRRYQGKGTGEITMFRELMPHFQANSVVLGDEYYCSYFDMAALRAGNSHFVVKLSKRANLAPVKTLSNGDDICRWTKPKNRPESIDAKTWADVPDHLMVRLVCVKVAQPGFRVQQFFIIASLLDDTKYTPHELTELFRRRWAAELYLNNLKTTLGMDQLRCRSPEMVQREILVMLLAHNLIRIHMACASHCTGKPLDQISFKHTVNVIREFTPHLRALTNDERATIYATIAYQTVGNRPGRHEPRVIKRRPKTFPYMTQARSDYQQSP